MKIFENFSLKNFNTFGLDHKCKIFIEIEYPEEIYSINKKFKVSESKFLVLGEGSNILITKDFDGFVLHPQFKKIIQTREDKNNIYFEVEAGVNWDEFVRFSLSKNLGGIENLISIPGLVGAAPIQNIGAYGQEIKDVIELINFFDFSDNVFKTYLNQKCKFEYRNSIFKQELKNKILITSIELKLHKNPKPNIDYTDVKNELRKMEIENPTIQQVSEIISKIREIKLPSPKEIGNAGSFFKNPILDIKKLETIRKNFGEVPFFKLNETSVKIPAAWLIEKIGYKGKSKGNVGTYHKQPLVLINLGNATGEEILNFANEIKDKVFSVFNIELETEVNIL